MMLACQIERHWSAIEKGELNEALVTLLGHYRKFGGMKKTVTCPSPGALFRQFTRKKTETRTRLVSEIVGYLCRVRQSADMTHEKFTVNFAKEFIRQQNRYGGRSKISKDWERYARSAAFIYAAYQCFPKLAEFRNWRELWGELNQFAAQEDEVKKLIGYAAFAAQVLDRTHVRSSLTKPFLVADIVTPNLRQFDQNELRLLAEIDLKAPIA